MAAIAATLALIATGSSKANAGQAGPPTSSALPTTTRALPANVVAAWPVLTKSLTSSEATQMPVVEEALSHYDSLTADVNSGGGSGEAVPSEVVSTALARRYYDANGTMGYVIPGAAGTTCTVEIGSSGPLGGGCTTTESAETNGMVRFTFLGSAGYEVSGLLPSGSSGVAVVINGTAKAISLNSDGGFDASYTEAPTSIKYMLPGGVEKTYTELFPKPPANEPAPPSS